MGTEPAELDNGGRVRRGETGEGDDAVLWVFKRRDGRGSEPNNGGRTDRQTDEQKQRVSGRSAGVQAS